MLLVRGGKSHKRSTKEHGIFAGATLVPEGKLTASNLAEILKFSQNGHLPKSFYILLFFFFQSLPLKGEESITVVILVRKHKVFSFE